MDFDVLFIGPHPDDVEIGAGGTILKMTKAGLNVAILDLTVGEPTPRGDPETRRKEAKKAAEILGVKERIILDLPNRYLRDSDEGRLKVAEVMRALRPKILFIPYPIDAHPDHVAGSQLAEASRFFAKFTKINLKGEPYYPERVIYYYASHKRYQFNASMVVDISEEFERKLEAVLTYRSQFGYEGRDEMMKRNLEAICSYYGFLVGVRYGEPFFTFEPVLIKEVKSFFL